ncbi:hypothetical protein Tco_0838879 [Tanacetum coccineum]|uniref:Uncharacterized protein n=1 Tax=Tanacetum coccineum TaxID=301880 RepID=A0ABQ5ARX0_9ASTR
MHILHVSWTFFTNTGLEVQVGYRTSLAILALTHSSTFFISVLLFFAPNTLLFCATRETDTLTFRIYQLEPTLFGELSANRDLLVRECWVNEDFLFREFLLVLKVVRATKVAMPLGMGNFVIAWMVDDTAWSSRIPERPKMMLYGDDARTTVNFMMAPIISGSSDTSLANIGSKGYRGIHPIFISVPPELAFPAIPLRPYHVDHLTFTIVISLLPPSCTSPLLDIGGLISRTLVSLLIVFSVDNNHWCNVSSHRGSRNTGPKFLSWGPKHRWAGWELQLEFRGQYLIWSFGQSIKAELVVFLPLVVIPLVISLREVVYFHGMMPLALFRDIHLSESR